MPALDKFKGRRLLAVDLDGTVLDSRKRLTDRTKAALAHANANGFLVVPVSGRIFDYLKIFHADVGLDGPVIGYNGASCMLPETGETLFEDPIGVPLSIELLEFARKRNIHINFYDNELVYFEKQTEMSDYYIKTFGVPFRIVDLGKFRKPTIKVVVLAAEKCVPEITRELRDCFGARIDISTSDATHVEILKAGANKGRALSRLAGMLELEREDVTAFGDGENDVSMLKWAGRSVAVANAHEKTKAVATDMIGHCDDEAVAGFLEAISA